MTNGKESVRRRHQRASRLSRDLFIDLRTAEAALKKAHALAKNLKKAGAGKSATRMAVSLAAHLETVRSALKRVRPAKPSRRPAPVRRQRGPV